MRPIERGEHPRDENDRPVIFKQYKDAIDYLEARLGRYCSYCERKIPSNLAVEHVRPKNPSGVPTPTDGRELDWTNFLLACTNCNSAKGDHERNLGDYIWPDRDNSFRAIDYRQEGIISPTPNVDPQRAQRTIEMVGLDRLPGSIPPPAKRDYRWKDRREAWGIVNEYLQSYREVPTETTINLILNTAKVLGHWSIWFTVFEDLPEIRKRLIELLPGTARPCFDADRNDQPCTRPGGYC